MTLLEKVDVMDKWEKLGFLIGSWDSPMSGEPGRAVAGSSTFSYLLDRNILIRNSRAEFAAEPGASKGLVHDDLLIIYQPPGGSDLQAIYFDNEGHVINYSVSFLENMSGVIFDSPATTFSPRARLVYTTTSEGTLEVEFFVAFSGDDLKSHVKGILLKKK